MRSRKSKILAIILSMCLVLSMFSGLAISTSALTPIEVIVQYASDDDAHSLSTGELIAAGVDANTVIAENLGTHDADITKSTLYIGAIERAVPSDVDTTAKIQSLVSAVNLAAAVAKIEDFNKNNNPNGDLSAVQIRAAGVVDVLDVNLTQYKVAIAAKADGEANTTAKIQAIINAVNADQVVVAINEIKGFAKNNLGANLTIELLQKVRVTGIVNENLDSYKAAINNLADDETLLDTFAEIQSLVSTVNLTVSTEKYNAAITKIKLAAADDNASKISKQDLIDLGVNADSIRDALLDSYRTAIEKKAESDVDSTSKVQAIINGVNKTVDDQKAAVDNAINAIKGFAAYDNASNLNVDQLKAVGADAKSFNLGTHGVAPAVSTGYVKAIEDATSSAVDTVEEIQAIVNKVNADEKDAALGAISDPTANNITIVMLAKAGVEITSDTADNNAVEANLPSYKAVILAAGKPAVKYVTANVQGFVTKANVAMNKIKAYTAGSNDGQILTYLTQAGVSNIVNGYAADYQAQLNAAANKSTLSAIQSVIDNVNASKALADAVDLISKRAGKDNATTAAELKAAGVVGAIDANNAEYQAAIKVTSADLLDSTGEIQAMVNAVHARLNAVIVIRNYASNDNAGDLTIKQLVEAGVPPASAINANLEAYKVKIAAATYSTADTTAEIVNLVIAVNGEQETAAIAKIESYNVANNASAMTIDELRATNIINVIDENLAAYRVAIAGKNDGEANTKVKIQDIITAVNASESNATFVTIKTFAANDNASDLTIAMLLKAGVPQNVIISQNLLAYKIAIANKAEIDLKSVADLTACINATNATQAADAISKIKGYAKNDNASELTIDQLIIADCAAGILTTNPADIKTAIEANLSAYKNEIANSTESGMDEISEIRNAVEAANIAVGYAKAVVVIQGYAGNASNMTIAQLKATGSDKDIGQYVLEANLNAYKAAISAKTSADLDTVAKISAVVIAANSKVAALVKISGDDNSIEGLTQTDFTNAGIVRYNNAILGLKGYGYKDKLKAVTAANRDTTEEIQAIIDSSNAADVSANINRIRDFAANDNASELTLAILSAAGITNLVPANLGVHKSDDDPDGTKHPSTGYIAAIESKAAIDADTKEEIQKIIDDVNTNLSSSVISGVSVGSIQGAMPAGSIDPTFVPTIQVAIPTSVSSFLATNLTATGLGVVTLYTSSDFSSGLVGVAGVAITKNVTEVYAKVVSANGISTRYYKVVLNVVDNTKKYDISNTQFTPVGSNYLATVTLQRGQAANLAHAKLLLIYTLADGETQVYLTVNASEGVNEVVVGDGVLCVDTVLIDGNVDWSAGSPISKSAFVHIDVPTEA